MVNFIQIKMGKGICARLLSDDVDYLSVFIKMTGIVGQSPYIIWDRPETSEILLSCCTLS